MSETKTLGAGVRAREFHLPEEPTEEQWEEWVNDAERMIGLNLQNIQDEHCCESVFNLIHNPSGEWKCPRGKRLEAIIRDLGWLDPDVQKMMISMLELGESQHIAAAKTNSATEQLKQDKHYSSAAVLQLVVKGSEDVVEMIKRYYA